MKKILVMGGGEFHDYEGCCEVMARQLRDLKGYEVEVSINDLERLRRGSIDQFDILVFYWTKDHLTEDQKRDLLSWCAEKGKFVGVHCAATAFRDCPEYEAMLGGRFRKHPPYREFYVTVKPGHPAMKYFEGITPPSEWENWRVHECKVRDEQFLIRYDTRVNVAAEAAFNGRLWPVVWTKTWGLGRVYYLSLGHDVPACDNAFFRHLLYAGIGWVDSEEPEPVDDSPFVF